MNIKFTILFPALFLVFISCSKNSDKSPTPATQSPIGNPSTTTSSVNTTTSNPSSSSKEDILTSGTNKKWKVSEIFQNGASQLLACVYDDITTFKKDKDYSLSIGGVRCFSAQADVTGKWNFSKNLDSITISSKVVEKYKIIELKEDKFIISTTDGNASETKVTYIPL